MEGGGVDGLRFLSLRHRFAVTPPSSEGGLVRYNCQLLNINYELSIDFTFVLGYKYSVEIYPFYSVKKL